MKIQKSNIIKENNNKGDNYKKIKKEDIKLSFF